MPRLLAGSSLVAAWWGATSLAFFPANASAQQSGDPNTAGGLAVSLGVLAGVLVAIVMGAKALDIKHKREAQGVAIQSQVADALMREGRLGQLVVTPTVRVPFWSGRPPILELAGRVPTEELRAVALQVARSEAVRLRPEIHIEDRIAVVTMDHIWAA